jgi:CDP-glucose 4,6-dehydratase
MIDHSFFAARVLVTGHTGFKGSWLTAWLLRMGAEVTGIALDPPTEPSHHEAARLGGRIRDLRIDVRDAGALREAVAEARPQFVFHLAAQALVRESYEQPVTTWSTNLMGTIHLLEALRVLREPCAAVMVTSDKCYDNVEWVWGYRETDALGGPDPYSGSKGGAELAIRSHVRSFFPSNSSPVRIAVARAGNVIGGGDWSSNRIVPDCVKAWSQGQSVILRNPGSTRPWQHVLEPLSGYLLLAASVRERPELHGQAFNFGPIEHRNHTVLDVVREMAKHWDRVNWQDASSGATGPHESGLLRLNCDKALHVLGWYAALGFTETVRMTAEWYKAFYSNDGPARIGEITDQQIAGYIMSARTRGIGWAL